MLWPGGKRFAFTIIDDPDGQGYEVGVEVYALLRDLGFRVSRAVWPVGPSRTPNSAGETCANPSYVQHSLGLQRCGFEIAYHNATPHTSPREETRAALERFRLIPAQPCENDFLLRYVARHSLTLMPEGNVFAVDLSTVSTPAFSSRMLAPIC